MKNGKDVNEVYEKFEKKITKVKHQAFGKCTKINIKTNSKVALLMKEQAKLTDVEEKKTMNELIAKEMINEKLEGIERDLERIKSQSKSHQHQIFNLRKHISGQDNFLPEAIIDLNSKELCIDK